MTDKQPEALRLADALHKRIALRYMGNCKCGSCQLVNADDVQDAAAELRRLHEVNAALVGALKALRIAVCFNEVKDFGNNNMCWDARVPVVFIEELDAALAKAEGK